MITNKLFKNKQTNKNKHAIQTILVILTFIQKTNYINNITTTVARRRFNKRPYNKQVVPEGAIFCLETVLHNAFSD